uniref:RNase H domain-containing protein n=1 Tax=Trichuris muris TaxID=70415 RepID=A0A5S6R1G3_TRIMR
MWTRRNPVGDVPQKLTRRTVFTYCGELVGHLPVCGWLRVAAAFAKRSANAATNSWDEPADDGTTRPLLENIAARGDTARVWVDASGLALGVALEVGDAIAEDASWLRQDDAQHINMAELDAVIRGLNLALTWKMTTIELMTDSSTVYRWITDGLSGKARLRTKAASEMLIRRRTSTVLSLAEDYALQLSVTLDCQD